MTGLEGPNKIVGDGFLTCFIFLPLIFSLFVLHHNILILKFIVNTKKKKKTVMGGFLVSTSIFLWFDRPLISKPLLCEL